MSFPIENAIPMRWREALFVCAKCMKRQDRKKLRRDVRAALKAERRKDIRVVPCGCLDLCPKRGVSVMRSRELGATPPSLHVLDNHESADALVAWLLAGAVAPTPGASARRRSDRDDR